MKALLIIGLLLFSTIASSQLYLLVDPAMRRAGLLYNQKFKQSKIGLYTKCQYGVINVPDFYTKSIKAGAGVSFRFGTDQRIYFGLNYNYFFQTVNDTWYIDLSRVEPVSIDIGIASGNEMRFKILFMTDPVNWETSLGFSYQFKNR
jgi:hypothetical protein